MLKISVIIPVYNTEKYLEKCLDSVCNQTLSDIEIICINDASQDESLAILNKYAHTDERIQIINLSNNLGAANARNLGLSIAKGKYISFIDSDDYIDLDFYDKLYNLAENTNADIAKGITGIDTVLNQMILKDKNSFYYGYTSAIFKKSLITENKINFPNLIDTEDLMFTFSCAFFANKIVLEDSAHYYIVPNSNSQTKMPLSHKRISDRLSGLDMLINRMNSINLDVETYNYISFNLIKNIFVESLNINEIEIKHELVSKVLQSIAILKYSDDFWNNLKSFSNILYNYFTQKDYDKLLNLSIAELNHDILMSKIRLKIKGDKL